MSDLPEAESASIDDILNAARDLTENRTSYINHARFTLATNEIMVDLYVIGTDPTAPDKIQAQRVHRIAIPISTAKDLGTLLLEAVERWENTMGVDLPFQVPEKDSAS